VLVSVPPFENLVYCFVPVAADSGQALNPIQLFYQLEQLLMGEVVHVPPSAWVWWVAIEERVWLIVYPNDLPVITIFYTDCYQSLGDGLQSSDSILKHDWTCVMGVARREK
jgi:hypothetical protein